MTPEQETRARDRFAILSGLRLGGIILLAVGLWMWLGGSFAGRYGFGTILVVGGAFGALLLPAVLARRWRTPR